MISIIVSWRDRAELEAALESLVATAERLAGEVIIVNYSGSESALTSITANFATRIKVVQVRGKEYFNKAAAQNVGASQARSPLLFFCDCDIILNVDSVASLIRRISLSADSFGTLAAVKETEPNSRKARNVVSFGYELNITLANGRRLKIVDNEEDAIEGTRQAPGLLIVKRSDFLAVGGYNSKLHGWGWEDQDMISRLILANGLTRITAGEALHISHDDHARIGAYPPISSRWESRDKMFRQALANYDEANFLGTYIEDVRSCQ